MTDADLKQVLEEKEHSPTFVLAVRVPELVAEVRRLRGERHGKLVCQLPGCGGWIGPDITERPTCYRCGTPELRPNERRRERERCASLVEDADIEQFGGYERQDDARSTLRKVADAIRALPDSE